MISVSPSLPPSPLPLSISHLRASDAPATSSSGARGNAPAPRGAARERLPRSVIDKLASRLHRKTVADAELLETMNGITSSDSSLPREPPRTPHFRLPLRLVSRSSMEVAATPKASSGNLLGSIFRNAKGVHRSTTPKTMRKRWELTALLRNIIYHTSHTCR